MNIYTSLQFKKNIYKYFFYVYKFSKFIYTDFNFKKSWQDVFYYCIIDKKKFWCKKIPYNKINNLIKIIYINMLKLYINI